MTVLPPRFMEMPDRPWRALARAGAFAVAVIASLLTLTPPVRAADPVSGQVRVSKETGFSRMVFHFDEEVKAKVTLDGMIMVIKFAKPVNVGVDKLNTLAPDLFSAARRDPDGSAVRIALAHPVKFNVIPAAERLFIDFLPENWSGVLPGLPQSVINELADRAQEATRLLKRRNAEAPRGPPLVRVKVAVQPTFTRYVFPMPDQADVVPDQSAGKITLRFDRQIRWDLADALATQPPGLVSIAAEMGINSTSVTFVLNGAPGVHSFREDRSLVIDIGRDGSRAGAAGPSGAKAAAPLVIEAPQTVAPSTASEAVPSGPPPKPAPAPAPAPAAQPPVPPPAKPLAEAKPQAPIAATAAKPKDDGQPHPLAEASKAAAMPAPAPADADAPVVAAMDHSGDMLKLTFPFAAPTPAAVFRRADMLWMVFDSKAKIDLAAVRGDPQGIRNVSQRRGADGEEIIRIQLDRPRLISATAEAGTWTIEVADTLVRPPQPLLIARSVVGRDRANIVIPFVKASAVHRLRDPEIGDRLVVVTALAPPRGFLKDQHFVELRTLSSSQGIVVQPIADDVTAAIAPDKVTISRPHGLSLSATALAQEQGGGVSFQDVTFDPEIWGFDQHAQFFPRQTELLNKAAAAPPARRKAARFALARFYLAQDMATEAKAVLDVALPDKMGDDDVGGKILRAVAEVLMDRPDEALVDLGSPKIGNQQGANLWRGIAFAREGKWIEAREAFKTFDSSVATLPLELQRLAMREALRTDLEVRDYSGAARLINEFETIGVSARMTPEVEVLRGRLEEGLGHKQEALTHYRAAIASNDRRAAAQGRLREIELLWGSHEMVRKDAVGALEMLTTVWRGDETETEGLRLLAHLYTEEHRYRDAFHVMKTAMLAHPSSDITRKIQDEAAATFDKLFLGGAGDQMPAVEALGLFYDYRELTPIGRRGDEMIRKLADRLVSVDLLGQAAELLQHQVDHRLEGAARAQVATKLATIYLMDHKPDKALATLQSTRSSDLNNELRDHRLLLEARALSELGRHGLALELIANMQTSQAIRLRGDILWAAKRWREAAEQIELLYGDRWRDFRPLNDTERSDILRAAIGYAMSDESIGLMRLREKYAAKMADTPDARAFNVVSAPIGTDGAEFQDVARRVASIDTLAAFIKDIETRYPDEQAAKAKAKAKPLAKPKPPAPVPAQTVKTAPPKPPAPPAAPKGVPLRPDPVPTGSIPERSRR